jgi:PhnB protein
MTKPVPDGWHSVTPRLVVHDAPLLVQFLKQAFSATGDFRPDVPSEIRLGDSLVMVSSVGPRDPMPAFLYLYVDDADATYERALNAGAVSLEEPRDTPYGDRRGMVKDPCGNIWQIATRKNSRWLTSAPDRGRAIGDEHASTLPGLVAWQRTWMDTARRHVPWAARSAISRIRRKVSTRQRLPSGSFRMSSSVRAIVLP